MAHIVYSSDSGIDTSPPPRPWAITSDMIIDRSPAGFTIFDATNHRKDVFSGYDFKFDGNGFPIEGIITEQHSYNDYGLGEKLLTTVTEWNGDAANYFKSLTSGDRYFFPGDTIMELGDVGNNNVTTGSGNDTIRGGSGFDIIHGQNGHDYLIGGQGPDFLYGGAGNDHLYGLSADGGSDFGDYLSGGADDDYLQGNAGDDTLSGDDGQDRINGGADSDDISGGAGNDSINGNRGYDTIEGGDGNDSIRGGQDDDFINGGSGDDRLSGDLGVDTLSGGAGADLFVFSGRASPLADTPDTIADYVEGLDHLSLGYTPKAVLTGSVQASLGVATTTAQQLFNAHQGSAEVAALMVGGDTYIFYSSDGGAVVDSAVLISGVTPSAFSVQDFV